MIKFDVIPISDLSANAQNPQIREKWKHDKWRDTKGHSSMYLMCSHSAVLASHLISWFSILFVQLLLWIDNKVPHRGPGSHDTKALWAHNLKYYVNNLFFNYKSDNPIRPQSCTCHSSWAAVTWAKLWSDQIIIFPLESSMIFLRDMCVMSSYILCEMGPSFAEQPPTHRILYWCFPPL